MDEVQISPGHLKFFHNIAEMAKSPIPLLLILDGWHSDMKEGMRVLVGIDGSEHSMWVLVEASNVAKKFSGSVKVITVYKQGMEEDAEKIRQKAQWFLETERVEFILSSILGGLGSAAAFLLGSVSKVVSKAPSVLVVKK